MSTYLVRAERAGRHWKLHIHARGVHFGDVHVRHFWDAETEVRTFMRIMLRRDVSADRFLIYGKSIPIGQNGGEHA